MLRACVRACLALTAPCQAKCKKCAEARAALDALAAALAQSGATGVQLAQMNGDDNEIDTPVRTARACGVALSPALSCRADADRLARSSASIRSRRSAPQAPGRARTRTHRSGARRRR